MLSEAASIDEWQSQRIELHPTTTDRVRKYVSKGHSASAIFDQMLSIGEHKNKLNREALHLLFRSCYSPADLETARAALELYQKKAIEINEDTSLLFVKACCRVGKPVEALASLNDPSLRLGLWSNTACWNVLAAHLDDDHVAALNTGSSGSDEEIAGDAVAGSEEASAAPGQDGDDSEVAVEAPAALTRAEVLLEAMSKLGVSPDPHTHELSSADAQSKAVVLTKAEAAYPLMLDEDAIPAHLLAK